MKLKTILNLENLVKKNKFMECFRSSVKAGININESMEFLIKTIVDKLDNVSNEVKIQETNKKSIVLENSKHTNKEKKENCC